MPWLLLSLVGFSLALGRPGWSREAVPQVTPGPVHGLDVMPLTFEPMDDSRPQSETTVGGATRAYQPPADLSSPRRTAGGGTRGGCDGLSAHSLTALAPQAHIGQTASTRPTLTWFVTDKTPYPIKVQLYRYRSSDPTDDRLELVQIFDMGDSQPGWMTLTLPETLAPLEVGETYRWKVILECSPSQPSRNRIDEADLQVVPPPATLEVAGDALLQAEQYLSAGLWYDGLAVLAQAPVSPAVATYRRELIASLAELEAENPNDQFSLFSDRLSYIATLD
jgi:hypothetical protein